MSEIYYNDTVKQAMKKLSTSTNVLEDYDNFTYNILAKEFLEKAL